MNFNNFESDLNPFRKIPTKKKQEGVPSREEIHMKLVQNIKQEIVKLSMEVEEIHDPYKKEWVEDELKSLQAQLTNLEKPE